MMNNATSNQDNFYIGWQEKTPTAYSKILRRFIVVVLILLVLTAGLLVLNQRGFPNSVFEKGHISTHRGILVKSPVPMLKVREYNEENGKQLFSSILLIGFGKSGAEATLASIEAIQGQNLEGRAVQLNGTLIYHQGKTALELTKGAKAFAGFMEDDYVYEIHKEDLGAVKLRGEILDPKCALGVMKPGHGKPHRSCAVRCISGGIPPVLKLTNKAGETNYCIVLGEKGQSINQELLDYVADQVQLCGRLEKQDDWLVLYTNPQSDIYRLKPYWMKEAAPMCREQ